MISFPILSLITGITEDTRTVQKVQFPVSEEKWRHKAIIASAEFSLNAYTANNVKPELLPDAPLPEKGQKPEALHVKPAYRVPGIKFELTSPDGFYSHTETLSHPCAYEATKDATKYGNKVRMFNERLATIVETFMGAGWAAANLGIVGTKEGLKLKSPLAADFPPFSEDDIVLYVQQIAAVLAIANEGKLFSVSVSGEPILVTVKLTRNNYGSNPNYLTLFSNGNWIERFNPQATLSLIQKHPKDVFDLIPEKPATAGGFTPPTATTTANADAWPDEVG